MSAARSNASIAKKNLASSRGRSGSATILSDFAPENASRHRGALWKKNQRPLSPKTHQPVGSHSLRKLTDGALPFSLVMILHARSVAREAGRYTPTTCYLGRPIPIKGLMSPTVKPYASPAIEPFMDGTLIAALGGHLRESLASLCQNSFAASYSLPAADTDIHICRVQLARKNAASDLFPGNYCGR